MLLLLFNFKVDRRQRLILQAEEESAQDNNTSQKTNPDTPGMHVSMCLRFVFSDFLDQLTYEDLQIIVIKSVY